MVKSLTEIANACGTDKGTITGTGHGYTLVYEQLFSARRSDALDICEIGLSIGGPELSTGSASRSVANVPSVRMWRDFFPQCRLVGVDISDCSMFATDWFDFVQADCGSAEELGKVAGLGRQFDIVVDDGSHAAFHQQLTFLELFPLVKPGGFYVIEDLHWQPETYAGTLPKVPRTDVLLDEFVERGSFFRTGALPLDRWTAVGGSIASVLIYDEDWLFRHRRQFNSRHACTPDEPSEIDVAVEQAHPLRLAASRIARFARRELRGAEQQRRLPRAKLAVIRKSP